MSDRYTYRTVWSQEDGNYVTLCDEFPSLSWLDASPETAEAMLKAAVTEVVAEMEATGEPLPQALRNGLPHPDP